MTDPDSIPFPTRPGTKWEHSVTADRCKKCGRPYNSHGSPVSHLDCPASEEDWDRYRRDRALATEAGTLDLMRRDLRGLSSEARRRILQTLITEEK